MTAKKLRAEFQWEDPLLLEDLLTEEERLVARHSTGLCTKQTPAAHHRR